MSRRPSNKTIKGRLDRLARELCHTRFGWQCVRCGEDSGLHWAHIVQRFGHHQIRWSELNSLTLCQPCHKWFDSKATARQQTVLVDRVSPKSFDWLEEVEAGIPRNEQLFSMTINDMIELAEKLKDQLTKHKMEGGVMIHDNATTGKIASSE